MFILEAKGKDDDDKDSNLLTEDGNPMEDTRGEIFFS
jgi:hypothetical protein